MHNLLYNIFTTLKKRKAISFLALSLVVVGLGFLATKITFEEDITKLIPTNSKSEEFQKVLKNVNFADKIIVNFKRQNNGEIIDLTEAANTFLDSVNNQAKDYIKAIQGQVTMLLLNKS